jgi:hypothetical protein
MFEFEQERKKGISHPDPIFLDGIEKQTLGYTTNPHSFSGVHSINEIIQECLFSSPIFISPNKKNGGF